MKGEVVLLAAVFLAGHVSAADSSIATGENTANYSVDITVFSKSCTGSGEADAVDKRDLFVRESYPPSYEAEFNGTVTVENPCALLDYNITRRNSSYVLDIYPVATDGPCVQCTGAAKYNASFEAVTTENFSLVIEHSGEQMAVFESTRPANLTEPDNRTGKPARRGIVDRLMGWFRNML